MPAKIKMENTPTKMDYKPVKAWKEKVIIPTYDVGKPEKTLKLLMQRQFHPWEGGEGEGKLHGVQENDIYYWMGCAYEGLGRPEASIACWKKAARGSDTVSPPIYYNDHQPDKILYQGLALLKIKKKREAEAIFHKLIQYGKEHMYDEFKIDYFAVSLPDLLIWEEDLHLKNRMHCHYLMALGELGLGNFEMAIQKFEEVLHTDRYHTGAVLHKSLAQQIQSRLHYL